MKESTISKIYASNKELQESIVKSFIRDNNMDIQCEKESCMNLKSEVDLI